MIRFYQSSLVMVIITSGKKINLLSLGTAAACMAALAFAARKVNLTSAIPPEALKEMDDTPQWTVHKHVSDFFDGKTDHEGWHKSQCMPVPKKGNLSDPNKWRGIMLMDMCSKVFS